MGPLTSVTGTPATSEDDFVFLDAEKHTDGFSKTELEESVKRLALGLVCMNVHFIKVLRDFSA